MKTKRTGHPPQTLARRLLCWWFGHVQHDQDPAPPEQARCCHCDTPIPYSDMVGDTRHARFVDILRTVWWWMFRKWWPKPCSDCGRRFGCDETIDHLPF